MIPSILKKLEKEHTATINELELLLTSSGKESALLLQTADLVRQRYVGDAVHLRAIIEFSNYCRCRCVYCGLQAQNSHLQRFRMNEEAILQTAGEAIKAGYRTLVLQSGEDLFFTAETMAGLVAQLKKRYPDVAITLSLGERSHDEYQLLKKAGADRYLIKHEIGEPELYKSLHDGDRLEARLEAIRHLTELGFQTGGGLLIGLPGQNPAIIAKDLLLMQSLNLRMASIGPFISHEETVLAGKPHGSLNLSLNAAALARLLMPYALIPSTSAFIALTGQPEKMLRAGANVLMQKAEPLEQQKLYDIYPKPLDERSIAEKRLAVSRLIRSMGRTVAEDRGDYPGDHV